MHRALFIAFAMLASSCTHPVSSLAPSSGRSSVELERGYLAAHQIPPDWFRAMVVGTQAQISKCRELDPANRGRVVLSVNIDADGSVKRANLKRADGVAPRISECLGSAILAWRFPPTGNGEAAHGALTLWVDAPVTQGLIPGQEDAFLRGSEALQACVRDAPEGRGLVVVRFMVELNGAVTSAEIVSSTAPASLADCVRRVAARARLTPFGLSDPVAVTHGFDLPGDVPPLPPRLATPAELEEVRLRQKALMEQWDGGGPWLAPIPAPPPPPTTAEVETARQRDQVNREKDGAAVTETVRRHADEVQACRWRALATGDQATGTLTLRFVIDPDGKVRSAQTGPGSFVSQALAECVRIRLLTWRFPRPAGGAIKTVEYQWTFAPEQI